MSKIPNVEFVIYVNNILQKGIYITLEEAKNIAKDYVNNCNKVRIETVNGKFNKWDLS